MEEYGFSPDQLIAKGFRIFTVPVPILGEKIYKRNGVGGVAAFNAPQFPLASFLRQA